MRRKIMLTSTGATSETPGRRRELLRQRSRVGIGAPGALEPVVIGDVARELRRDEARFDNTCPPRFMRNGISRASSASNTTTASALIAPFLVAPSDSTSTPQRQVRSAGEHSRAATAFANRAPSMCTRRPWRRATAPSAEDSSSPYERAEVRGLRDVQREGLDAMLAAPAGERQRLVERPGIELVVPAGQAHELSRR